MNFRESIYFPHIPKCGGTSIKKFLEFNDINTFFDFDFPPSQNKYFNSLSNRRNNEFKQMNFDVFDVIFGHYPLKRYNYRKNVILLLRHPVERAISHFNYWKYALPKENLIAIAKNPIINDIKSGKCSYISFLENNCRNVFSEYLDGLEVANVKKIFFTNQINQCFDNLSNMFGTTHPQKIFHERKNNIFKYSPSKSELKFSYNFLKNEIDIFQKFSALA